MRSKTVKRILKETPENTRELVRQRANEMVKEKALTPESEDQEKLWEEVFLMITDAHVLTPILDKLMKEYTITRK